MTNFPKDDAPSGKPKDMQHNPETTETAQTKPIQLTEQKDAPSCGDCQCPYGQPRPKANRGSKLFVGILVGIAAAFVIGYGGYAIFLSIQQSFQDSEISISEEESSPSTHSDTGTAKKENPVGTGTDSKFAGLEFAAASDEDRAASEIYEQTQPSVVSVVLDGKSVDASAQGDYYASGIVLTKDGYLLTTAHAIGYSRENIVTVVTPDGTQWEATIVGYDATSDIAVLKIDATNLTPATLGKSSSVGVGDWIYAVGAADDDEYSGVLTRGIVSAKNRKISYDSVTGTTYLQTDAAIGVGGSGGALVNTAGQVIGLNISNWYLDSDYTGESYTIPIDQVKDIVSDLIRNGYVTGKARLGISGTDVTQSQSADYGLPQGVVIVEMEEDSVFQGMDVAVGDVITAIDGTEISGMEDITAFLKSHKAGETVTVTLFRLAENGQGGESFDVTIQLLADEGETQK